ncbi:MAG: 50S ribosome-binding GTPase [Candidatus Woesearchaeota archaeon]|nr:50S ribosome-binding GTPase [Nanoarchaeota archaeon]USN44368.1 MAG: 50S ribosome-binding GTPase [Candidatus Woesearchaeota archaeon]
MAAFSIPLPESSESLFSRVFEAMEAQALKEKEDISERFSKSASTQKKTKEDVMLEKRKDLELSKIRYLNVGINKRLRKIVASFPKLRKIHPLYIDLLDTTSYTAQGLSDALEIVRLIGDRIDELTTQFEHRLKYAKSSQTVGYLIKKYFGRVHAVFERDSEAFSLLREAAVYLNSLAKYEDMFTVSIAGFPNVGKSTLMKHISHSDVEIQPYPFTTKGLMFAYLGTGNLRSVQLVDTPGLLGRELSNEIELKAQVIITSYSSLLVFVIDCTLACGYDTAQQKELLEQVLDLKKETYLYFSKTDLYNADASKRRKLFEKEFSSCTVFDNGEDLKDALLKRQMKESKSFDIRNIQRI